MTAALLTSCSLLVSTAGLEGGSVGSGDGGEATDAAPVDGATPIEAAASDGPDEAQAPLFAVMPFADAGASPRRIGLNASFVVVVGGAEQVLRIDRSTRSVTPLAAPSATLTDLATTSDAIYVSGNVGTTCGVPAKIWRGPFDDGGAFVEVTGGKCRRMLAVSADSFDAVGALDNTITGLVALLLSPHVGGQSRVIPLDIPDIGDIAAKSSEVFALSPTGRRIVRVSKSGDGGVDFAATDSRPIDIVADDTSVYWIELDGVVRAKPITGTASSPVVDLAKTSAGPSRLAQDSTHLYFTNATEGAVWQLPKSGGTPTAVATGQAEPFAIAADDAALYWANRADGTLMVAVRR